MFSILFGSLNHIHMARRMPFLTADNYLFGTIPNSIGGLTKLEELSLGKNRTKSLFFFQITVCLIFHLFRTLDAEMDGTPIVPDATVVILLYSEEEMIPFTYPDI